MPEGEKDGGLVVMVGDNLPSPGRNRVNWLAKYWGGGAVQWPPWHLQFRHHCLLSSFHKLRKYFEISRYLIFSLSLELHTLLQLLAKMSHNYRLLSLVYAIDNNSFLRNSWDHFQNIFLRTRTAAWYKKSNFGRSLMHSNYTQSSVPVAFKTWCEHQWWAYLR